jgi:polyhydroxyalkanoate synthesis regulator phasin
METTELEVETRLSPIAKLRSTMMYNIWLAGLGAYAKSGDEVNQLTNKGRSLFEELVERGRVVESQTQEKVHTMKSQTSVALEERIQRTIQRLLGVDAEFLDELDIKLDKLAEQVEGLAEKNLAPVVAKGADKPSVSRRKPVAKKAPSQTNVDAVKAVELKVSDESAESAES